MNYEKKFNAVPVSVDDLYLAVSEVHKMAEEKCDWEGRMLTLGLIFDGDSDKSQAVDMRLTALANIVSAGVLPVETVVFEGEGAQVAPCVWQAAAIAHFKVDEASHAAEFERQQFLDMARTLATKPEARH
jgi:hypothetical protein